jgi:hypothetical protein
VCLGASWVGWGDGKGKPCMVFDPLDTNATRMLGYECNTTSIVLFQHQDCLCQSLICSDAPVLPAVSCRNDLRPRLRSFSL